MQFKQVLNVVECHTGGENNKVVVGGIPPLKGNTMFEKKVWFENNLDHIRKFLLFEPRGCVTQCANLLVPSNNPQADMGYIILESEECPPMSGSNTICVATVILETGLIPMVEPVTQLTLEAPGGLITLECECSNGKVTNVRFINQPAFVYHLNEEIIVPDFGPVTIDVAYGGMTYALVDAESVGFKLVPDEARDLVVLGQKIKEAAAEQLEAIHPENSQIFGITQTEFTGPIEIKNGTLQSKNTVIVSPGRIDRSPCGTGTSARLAVMHAKGVINKGDTFGHLSIIDSYYEGEIVDMTHVGNYEAIIPKISGQAFITGTAQYGLDPNDSLVEGFTLPDTWMKVL